jgi:Multicopper oxidase
MLMEGRLPNYFTINGKAYPETDAIYVRVGRRIRLRFIGTNNNFMHPMHVHGGPFEVVARDGQVLSPHPIAIWRIRSTSGLDRDMTSSGLHIAPLNRSCTVTPLSVSALCFRETRLEEGVGTFRESARMVPPTGRRCGLVRRQRRRMVSLYLRFGRTNSIS